MDDRITSLLGLVNGGKRVYQVKDGEVSAIDFEYATVVTQLLWSEKGLVDTLGPTWEMVHDPRFESIERQFISKKKGKFGGHVTSGIQYQNADGYFEGSFGAIEQYTEVMSEGRNLIQILQSRAIIDACAELFPDRSFKMDPNDSMRGLKLIAPYTPGIRQQLADKVKDVVGTIELSTISDQNLFLTACSVSGEALATQLGILDPTEKSTVQAKAASYVQYEPHALVNWADEDIWSLLKMEYTNYFTRQGKPNKIARTLYKLIKCDLAGLIADYCEVANVQEWVLIEDPDTLYDPAKHSEEVGRVWMETDLLERALSYRAEIRTTAARLLNYLNLGDHAVDLTDQERDDLVKIIYTSKWPDEQPEMISSVLGFLASVRVSGKSAMEREADQIAAASAKARQHVAGLKDGSILPISRETEEVVERGDTADGFTMQRALHDPIAMTVFLRLASIEKRIAKGVEIFTGPLPDDMSLDTPEVKEYKVRKAFAASYLEANLRNEPITIPPNIYGEELAVLDGLDYLVKARSTLTPVFEDENFQWTDEAADRILAEAEFWDPTPKPAPTGEVDENGKLLPATVTVN